MLLQAVRACLEFSIAEGQEGYLHMEVHMVMCVAGWLTHVDLQVLTPGGA